jgi:hypothetical protein
LTCLGHYEAAQLSDDARRVSSSLHPAAYQTTPSHYTRHTARKGGARPHLHFQAIYFICQKPGFIVGHTERALPGFPYVSPLHTKTKEVLTRIRECLTSTAKRSPVTLRRPVRLLSKRLGNILHQFCAAHRVFLCRLPAFLQSLWLDGKAFRQHQWL